MGRERFTRGRFNRGGQINNPREKRGGGERSLVYGVKKCHIKKEYI